MKPNDTIEKPGELTLYGGMDPLDYLITIMSGASYIPSYCRSIIIIDSKQDATDEAQ